jgi:hypothetical protein
VARPRGQNAQIPVLPAEIRDRYPGRVLLKDADDLILAEPLLRIVRLLSMESSF